MGHIRFGRMPKTRSWQQVAQLLADDGADASAVASATINAASTAFEKMADDPGMQVAFWALTQITLRAREADFVSALRKAGIDVSGVTDQFQLIAKVSEHVRNAIRQSGRETVFSEMARLSLASVLTKRAAGETGTLFDRTLEDVRLSLRELSTKKNFAAASRDLFAEFLRRTLRYFISTEICNHVGPSGRFKDIDSTSEFDEALEVYSKQSARIVEEFSGGWYSKTEYEKGIGPEEAKRFLHVAMDKLRSEFEGGPSE